MANQRKEALARRNLWDELLALRDEQRAKRSSGIQVVKESELPLENNRQGLMRWYLHPTIDDTALTTLFFFQQVIPPGSRSGKLQFQGGQVIFITEGRGYTLVDGVKHSWQAGDILNLPIKPQGIIIQHFNSDADKQAAFVATEPNFFSCTTVDRGSGFEQLENSPDYVKPAL